MTSLQVLTQKELLALSLEATRKGDAAHSLACLKEAASRDDAPADVYFLLGSHYAQLGLMDDAFAHLQRSVELAPDSAIARFQLGLLRLTNAQPDEALLTWAPLADLGPDHALASFRQGLEHLIRDEFDNCTHWLERGIVLNTDNPALNGDMQLIIDRVKAVQAENHAAALAEPAEEGAKNEEPQSHLFLNAYTGGKVH